MPTEFLKIVDLPKIFLDVVMREFTPYSVAIGRVRNRNAEEFAPLGSGVLVQKNDRFGILTARHCLKKCQPNLEIGPAGKDSLVLIVSRGKGVVLEPPEVMEHNLVDPITEEYGPDLSFIEIIHPERLASIRARASFWPMGQNFRGFLQNYGVAGTLICSVGYPETNYSTFIDRNDVHHSRRHMSFINTIREGDIFERDGWDYIETTCLNDGSSQLPLTFKGVSGGPVWAMKVRQHESDGHFSIEESALIGITFYQTERVGNERKLRAHFIESIYERAWRNINRH